MRTDNFVFKKSPEAVLDFSINWGPFTAGPIDSSSWTLASGLTITNTNVSGVYTTIWVSGGTLGSSYCGTNIIQASGLMDSATFSIYIV
jgi:hypothetical protein